MTDYLIVAGAALGLGMLIGFIACYYTADVPARLEEQRQQEIERRLRGKVVPRHRSTAEPAVIRSARIVGSKVWRS